MYYTLIHLSSLSLTSQDSLFSIIAAFLFTASGSVTIAYWSHGTYTAQSYSQEAGFALGAFCIITGMDTMDYGQTLCGILV